MRTFRFWEVLEDTATGGDGKRYALRAWGGSDLDRADALLAAGLRLAEMQAHVAARSGLSPSAAYEYGTRVLREERLALLAGTDAGPEAVLTRNRYGAPVLSARRLFIADIDFPPPKPSLKFWAKPPDPADAALAAAQAWAQARGASLRAYRTPAGLRLLRTDRPVDAEAGEAGEDLQALGSDPLYRALCRRQGCFRARLGPKPWRMGLPLPPGQFPRASREETRFREWLAKYEETARGYAACRYVAAFGAGAVDERLAALVQAHDEGAGALSDRALA